MEGEGEGQGEGEGEGAGAGGCWADRAHGYRPACWPRGWASPLLLERQKER